MGLVWLGVLAELVRESPRLVPAPELCLAVELVLVPEHYLAVGLVLGLEHCLAAEPAPG